MEKLTCGCSDRGKTQEVSTPVDEWVETLRREVWTQHALRFWHQRLGQVTTDVPTSRRSTFAEHRGDCHPTNNKELSDLYHRLLFPFLPLIGNGLGLCYKAKFYCSLWLSNCGHCGLATGLKFRTLCRELEISLLKFTKLMWWRWWGDNGGFGFGYSPHSPSIDNLECSGAHLPWRHCR